MAPTKPLRTYRSATNKSADALNSLLAKNMSQRLISKKKKRKLFSRKLPDRVQSYLSNDSLQVSTEDTFDKLKKGPMLNQVNFITSVNKTDNITSDSTSSIRLNKGKKNNKTKNDVGLFSPVVTRRRFKMAKTAIIDSSSEESKELSSFQRRFEEPTTTHFDSLEIEYVGKPKKLASPSFLVSPKEPTNKTTELSYNQEFSLCKRAMKYCSTPIHTQVANPKSQTTPNNDCKQVETACSKILIEKSLEDIKKWDNEFPIDKSDSSSTSSNLTVNSSSLILRSRKIDRSSSNPSKSLEKSSNSSNSWKKNFVTHRRKVSSKTCSEKKMKELVVNIDQMRLTSSSLEKFESFFAAHFSNSESSGGAGVDDAQRRFSKELIVNLARNVYDNPDDSLMCKELVSELSKVIKKRTKNIEHFDDDRFINDLRRTLKERSNNCDTVYDDSNSIFTATDSTSQSQSTTNDVNVIEAEISAEPNTTDVSFKGEQIDMSENVIDATIDISENIIDATIEEKKETDIIPDVIESSFTIPCSTNNFKVPPTPPPPRVLNYSTVNSSANSSINSGINDSSCIIDITTTIPRKTVLLKPGKSWRRSLITYKNSLLFSKVLNHELASQRDGGSLAASRCLAPSAAVASVRRSSMRMVPTDKPPAMRGSLSEIAEMSYVSERLLGHLDNSFRNISLRDDDKTSLILEENQQNLRRPQPLPPHVSTAKEIILRKCGQIEAETFQKCYSDRILQNCHKIGEGVYGEVFLFKNPTGGTSVIKIIPVEGDQIVNGERQKKYDEILSEIIIATELSNLKHKKINSTSAFNEVQNVRCVKGRYPQRLLDLWDLYDETRRSENDCPDMFDEDQHYIILQLHNGGEDLEAYKFNNAVQVYYMFQQIAFALAVAENELKFEHRDLHWGNILLSTVDKDEIETFILNGKTYKVPSHGVRASIIDFTLSRIELDGVVIFNDLSEDEELFTGDGDYQFEIYRMMQQRNGNNWQKFEPSSNLLWLDYVLEKISALNYRNPNSKVHKQHTAKLKHLRNEILNYNSVYEFINNVF